LLEIPESEDVQTSLFVSSRKQIVVGGLCQARYRVVAPLQISKRKQN
jgi:hypothetical protein